MRASNPDGSDFYCRYNAVTDTFEHGLDVCRRYKDDASLSDEGEELGYCGIPEHVDRLSEIKRLELVSIWPKLLENPSLAEVNDVIHEGWIYSSKYGRAPPFSGSVMMRHNVRRTLTIPIRCLGTSCRPGRPPIFTASRRSSLWASTSHRVPARAGLEEAEGL